MTYVMVCLVVLGNSLGNEFAAQQVFSTKAECDAAASAATFVADGFAVFVCAEQWDV